MTTEHREFIGHTDIDKRFVDRVELDLVRTAIVVQYIHHAMREFIVERVIARNDRRVMPLEEFAMLKERRRIWNAKSLHLVAARNDDAVVV